MPICLYSQHPPVENPRHATGFHLNISSLENYFFHYSGATPYSHAYFGEGSGPIHLDSVECSGTEYNVTECEIAGNTRQTTHSQDVGVKCQPGNKYFRAVKIQNVVLCLDSMQFTYSVLCTGLDPGI